MPRRLFLHVGLPKTGSTSMQKWFLDNRTALAAQGLCYPIDPPLHNYKQGYTVLALKVGDMAPLRAALDQAGASDVLLSNEGLSNHFLDFPAEALAAFRTLTADIAEALAAFRTLTADIAVIVIGFHRDPDRWLRSYHRQAVLNPRNNASELWGTSQDLAQIRAHYRIKRLLDHDRLAKDMAQGVGADAVHMLNFDDPAAFTRMLGVMDVPDLSDIPLPRINETLPDWAITMMQRINAQEPDNPARQAWKGVLYHYLKSNHTVLRDDANRMGADALALINPALLDEMPTEIPHQDIRHFLNNQLPAIVRT